MRWFCEIGLGLPLPHLCTSLNTSSHHLISSILPSWSSPSSSFWALCNFFGPHPPPVLKCLGFLARLTLPSNDHLPLSPFTSSLLHLLILLWLTYACLNIGSSTTSSFLATAPALWSRIEIPPCSSFLLARQRFPIWSEPDIRDFITGTSGQAGEDLLFVTKDSCQRCSLTHSVQSSDLDVDTTEILSSVTTISPNPSSFCLFLFRRYKVTAMNCCPIIKDSALACIGEILHHHPSSRGGHIWR